MEDESFFEDSSVGAIAEAHIVGIGKLEEREARRIMNYYSEVRKSLRDRLDSMKEGSFDAQRMRGTLVQVELAISELSKRLRTNLRDSAQESALLGVNHLFDEINKFDQKFLGAVTPINLNALAIATDTTNFLMNRYESSMDAYDAGLIQGISQILSDAVLEGVNLSNVVGRISKIFMGEEWKIHRLVRTEIHNIYNVGKIKSMGELQKTQMPDLMKTLWHTMDHRTGEDSIQLSKNNPIVPIDEPFVETSTGKKLSYMNPPNRPNDRAILIPYREAWTA